MNVEIFVQRLRTRITKEIAENHAQMDKGKSPDEYMKLVGRNAALVKVGSDFINEAAKDLAEELDD